MSIKKIIKGIASLAPGLATALGGPLAGAAVKAVSRAILGREDATEDELAQAVEGMSSEHRAQLYQADLEFKKEMGRQGIQLVEISHKNTADARAMQVAALAQADVFSKQFVYWFAIGWSLFGAAYIVGITFYNVPQASVRFADTILGFLLGTLLATILNFFFGSSYSSKAKDETIKSLGGAA